MFIFRLVAYIAILILFVLTMLHIAIYYDSLENPVGSHFDAQGRIDGWMPKASLVATYVLTQLLLPALLLVIGKLPYILPESTINLPNKDYWLAPDQRAETLGTIEAMLAWVSVVTMALMIAIMHVTFLVNLEVTTPTNSLFLVIIITYSVLVMGLVAWVVLRFKKIPTCPTKKLENPA